MQSESILKILHGKYVNHKVKAEINIQKNCQKWLKLKRRPWNSGHKNNFTVLTTVFPKFLPRTIYIYQTLIFG